MMETVKPQQDIQCYKVKIRVISQKQPLLRFGMLTWGSRDLPPCSLRLKFINTIVLSIVVDTDISTVS